MEEKHLNPDISIIIVNYNTCGLTCACIDSIIEKTSGISYEIIIIDNNSRDESKSVLENDSRIKYTYLNENIGFGRANNVGLQVAKGRNIFFLNSDTLLVNNAIKILSDFLDMNPSVGACGGNLYTATMSPTHSFQRTSPLMYELDTLIMGRLSWVLYGKNADFNHSKNQIDVKCIVGADLMIKKSVINRIGAFDSKFFMYCEESELLHRVRKSGYRVVNIPEAKIIHLEGKSFPSEKQIARIVMFRQSLKLYCDLHYNIFYYPLVNLLFNLTIFTRIAGYSILGSPKKNYWKNIRKKIREEII